MTQAETRVRNAIKDCLLKAEKIYGFDEPVEVKFRNCGRTAGWAQLKGGYYTLVFNTQMLSDQFIDHLIGDTVPHEIAHLVCYFNPTLGKNHDRGWQRVCTRLGGNGQRCHAHSIKKARRSRKAIYNIDGEIHEIGGTVHKKIQQGASYSMRCSGKRILPEYFTGKIVMK